ncbi:MAG: DciA family protein [Sphingomonas sp.]|nr:MULTISPECIES: DciA family protein [Sphingomonas]ATI55841.1 DUF721 domain-containing protein [Sphingomonas melonis]MBI0530455.1 DUF721 domain-containing protein [Sphingomonas sp. TX0522]MBX8844324.1 DUF721 domain-containing protein [Sphingomonas melonis]MBX8852575.1 DUF721 domain-containing protein [Sphingomonas melonis]MBX8897666.1 DUF721 domain-containing protein [Sphingomonas melonis]
MSKRARATDTEAPRQNRARAVSELLPAIHGAAFKRFGFVQSALVTRWPEIVGERWAAASAPESLRFPPGQKANGVLTIVVRGAHAPMMQHIAPEIVERVNRFFGYAAVAKLTIRQGDVAKRLPRSAPVPPREAPAEIGEGLKTIADPELRAVLEALAAGVHAPRTLPRIS